MDSLPFFIGWFLVNGLMVIWLMVIGLLVICLKG